MLPSVAILRRGGDMIAPRPEIMRCAECGCAVAEDEGQAVRWGYWSDDVGDVYPFCAICAEREFRPQPFRERATLEARGARLRARLAIRHGGRSSVAS
jgi:hypothetical protein